MPAEKDSLFDNPDYERQSSSVDGEVSGSDAPSSLSEDTRFRDAEDILAEYLPGEDSEESGPEVGCVEGSEAATSGTFYAVQDERLGRLVQLDDILTAIQHIPDEDAGGTRELHQYGVVVEAESRLEGVAESNSTFDVASNIIPSEISRRVKVQILRSEPDVGIAPHPGGVVRRSAGTQRKKALYRDQMDRPLPAGLDQLGRPLCIDLPFLDGEKGGHMSISGISGVATKTSYALFVLYMLLESDVGREIQGIKGNSANESKALVFNVKDQDLMYLDIPSRKFGDKQRREWTSLGVPDPEPFSDVALFTPFKSAPGATVSGALPEVQPDTDSRDPSEVTAYGFTPWDFVYEGLMEYLLHLDPEKQVSMLEEEVRVKLMQVAYPLEGGDRGAEKGAIVLAEPRGPEDPEQLQQDMLKRGPRKESEGYPVIRSYRDLLEHLAPRIKGNWGGEYASGTKDALIRRLHGQKKRGGRLIRCGVEKPGVAHRKINVVDIHQLHDDAQRFVVGVCLRDIYADRRREDRNKLRVVLLDELNKYAPREGDSPIKETLREIATMGRSKGVILFGAQQATKSVDEKVVQMASIKADGRLDPAEAREHGYLTRELRERATRFKPGQMALHQPLIPEAIPMRFPLPPFATNKAEAEQGGAGGARGRTGGSGGGGDSRDENPGFGDLI